MRVLFVEDDAMNRRVVRTCCAWPAPTWMRRRTPSRGLPGKIDEGNYDVVLMDLRMPGMDGLTAIRYLRARTDAKSHIPRDRRHRRYGPEHPAALSGPRANEVIMKPVSMENACSRRCGRTVAGSGNDDILI